MNNDVYNKLLSSIGKEIKNIIDEQFKIGNMDFNNKKQKFNIFNKATYNSKDIFDKILNNKDVSDDEINFMNYNVSEIAVKYRYELEQIINFYSTSFPNDSLNWLDVSEIKEMN